MRVCFRSAGSASDVVRRQSAGGEPGAGGAGRYAANAQRPADAAAGTGQPRRPLFVRRLQQPHRAGARLFRHRQDAT